MVNIKRVWCLLALIFLTPFLASAGQLVPKWGFEKNIIANGVGGGERLYAIEYLQPIGRAKAMQLKAEVGGWIAKQQERKSSLEASISWGYRVQMPWGPFLEAFLGPGYVKTIDDRTSSHFQIVHDVSIGAINEGYGLSLGFKHVSNAGLAGKNLGRDFMMVRFLIPINT